MRTSTLRDIRLRSHRLVSRAGSLAQTASHMLAVQSQEFWGGRWALAVRTAGSHTIDDVDALFDDGTLVRSWTMRGTIHTIPAVDLAWVLGVTGSRQLAKAAARRRDLGLDEPTLSRAEQLLRAALRGGHGLSRVEAFGVLEAAGISTGAQRGLHVLHTLCMRGVLCQGPVVRRTEGISREQRFVLVEEYIRESASPADPLAELFVRYMIGHGPAGVADFAWWSGLTLSAARAAADAAANRVERVDDDLYVDARRPHEQPGPGGVVALPSFDEYYISYVDRTVLCPPEHLGAVGPARNGMVRPVLVADGFIVGVWRHSTSVTRRDDVPMPELFVPGAVSETEVKEALDRYAAFVTV